MVDLTSPFQLEKIGLALKLNIECVMSDSLSFLSLSTVGFERNLHFPQHRSNLNHFVSSAVLRHVAHVGLPK